MPELPDVELIRQYVEEHCLYQQIAEADITETSIVEPSQEVIKKGLKNHKFCNTYRLGKYLFISLDTEKQLVMHFGMTGKLKYVEGDKKKIPAYTRFTIRFDNGNTLFFTDRRKIGRLYFTDNGKNFIQEKELGEDALDISFDNFEKAIDKKKGMIKAVLTDQHIVSGIGNVYADEILYQVKVHPKKSIDTLDKKEVRALYDAMRDVLKTAIDYKGDRKNLPQHYLTPFRKEDADCPSGKGKVALIKVGGRSTYYCPECQRL